MNKPKISFGKIQFSKPKEEYPVDDKADSE